VQLVQDTILRQRALSLNTERPPKLDYKV